MRSAKFLSCIFILLFCASILVSASSTISTKVIDNIVSVKEEARFSLTVTNLASSAQTYSLYSMQSGRGWNVEPFPLKDKTIELAPSQTYTTTIKAQALEDFAPGIYYVDINLQSNLGESYTETLKIYLSSETPLDYLPSIKATIDMDEKINPQEPVSIKLFLENRNPLDLTGLKIKVQSEMPEFGKEVNVDLPPMGKKTIEIAVTPNPYQQPKEYMLFFVFERDGQTVKILDQKVEVLSLMPAFLTEYSEEKLLLKTEKHLEVTNGGNVRNTQKVKIPITLWQSFFTESTGKVEKENKERFLVWELSLGPDESETLDFQTNYRPLAYFLIVALILAGVYLYLQSALALSKGAQVTRSNDEEGALSEIKITLEARNKSKHPLKDVMIVDRIPSITNLEKSLELGTLKPQEVKHGKKETVITWSLAELEGNEHRIITYRIKAKLNILGVVSLPRATAAYVKKNQKKGKSFSNIFRLGL